MELTRSQREDIAHDADVNNLISKFSGIECDNNTFQGSLNDAIIVLFDLDTTDLYRTKEICKISAWCNGSTFNQYIIPVRNITLRKYERCGMRSRKLKWCGNFVPRERLPEMLVSAYHQNKIVLKEDLSSTKGLTKFLEFLGNQNGQVLLAAHDCLTFDGSTVVRQMKRHNLFDTFQSHVLGFVDTLQIFKTLLPQRIQEKKEFSLAKLATDYLDEDSIPEGTDGAINVDILRLLITAIGCTDEIMKKHAKPLDVFILSMPETVEAISNLEPIKCAVSSSVLTKIARAGISMDILRAEYSVNGDVGVSRLLQENKDGGPLTTLQTEVDAILARLYELSTNENNENKN